MQFTDSVIPHHDARVVPRRDGIEAQGIGALKQGVELDVLVATHARVGGTTCRVFTEEVGDHKVMEFVTEIPDVIRDAELFRGPACVVAVLDGTATS